MRQLRIYFAKSNQDTISRILQALDVDDVKLAHRLAHTLKGNAGQIGEKHLHEIAATVEGLLKDGNIPGAIAQMVYLETELQAVLAGLAPLVTQEDEKSRTEITDPAKIQEILNELEPMLIKRNPESMNMLDDIRAIADADDLAQMVEDFDFRNALSELERLRGGL